MPSCVTFPMAGLLLLSMVRWGGGDAGLLRVRGDCKPEVTTMSTMAAASMASPDATSLLL